MMLCTCKQNSDAKKVICQTDMTSSLLS